MPSCNEGAVSSFCLILSSSSPSPLFLSLFAEGLRGLGILMSWGCQMMITQLDSGSNSAGTPSQAGLCLTLLTRFLQLAVFKTLKEYLPWGCLRNTKAEFKSLGWPCRGGTACRLMWQPILQPLYGTVLMSTWQMGSFSCMELLFLGAFVITQVPS
jgi:hypothetical protein